MAKDKPGAAWGTDCEAELLYDMDDNYYLLTWNDPNCIEIRNTKQVIAAIATSMVEDECKWLMCNKSSNTIASSDIKELMDWLNAEQDGSERIPSENFISDDCGYVWIRRILTKYED
jgi:hypothetical protein